MTKPERYKKAVFDLKTALDRHTATALQLRVADGEVTVCQIELAAAEEALFDAVERERGQVGR